jgi:hypothetical protein
VTKVELVVTVQLVVTVELVILHSLEQVIPGHPLLLLVAQQALAACLHLLARQSPLVVMLLVMLLLP